MAPKVCRHPDAMNARYNCRYLDSNVPRVIGIQRFKMLKGRFNFYTVGLAKFVRGYIYTHSPEQLMPKLPPKSTDGADISQPTHDRRPILRSKKSSCNCDSRGERVLDVNSIVGNQTWDPCV